MTPTAVTVSSEYSPLATLKPANSIEPSEGIGSSALSPTISRKTPGSPRSLITSTANCTSGSVIDASISAQGSSWAPASGGGELERAGRARTLQVRVQHEVDGQRGVLRQRLLEHGHGRLRVLGPQAEHELPGDHAGACALGELRDGAPQRLRVGGGRGEGAGVAPAQLRQEGLTAHR